MKRIKNKEELLKCEGKIICFWGRGSDRTTKPHYYEWVVKVKDRKILIRTVGYNNKWTRASWDNVDDFNFLSNDWFVMDFTEFNKRMIIDRL